MDKKNIIIATSWLALALLTVEYRRLTHDFKSLYKEHSDNEGVVERARTIAEAVVFAEIVENLDED